MARLKGTKILPVALTLIIVAIVFATLVTIIRVAFFSSSDNSNLAEISAGRDDLVDSSAGRSVQMVVRGNIVGDENFRSYKIVITPNSRTVTKKIGYLGDSKILFNDVNNIQAYEQFVNALDKANLMNGAEFTGDKDDMRGICATGRVYDFIISDYNQVKKHLWTSTCAGSPGSLTANLQQVYNLFTAQIPDSKSIIDKIWL